MIDENKLRELAKAVISPLDSTTITIDTWIELQRHHNAFVDAANPQAILALLDELDRLREQVRQHEAFQQFANATEQQRQCMDCVKLRKGK